MKKRSTREGTTNLGKLLTAYRYWHQLDAKTVGVELGISASTVSRIEAGTLPDGETFTKILTWLFTRATPEAGGAPGSVSGGVVSHGGLAG